MIRAFVIRLMEKFISKLIARKNSNFLASGCSAAGWFGYALDRSPEDRSLHDINWATSRENLFSGFPEKEDSNQSAKLQRLARKIEFRLKQA